MRLSPNSISPFSNKLSVYEEYHEPSGDTLMLCMDTGYHTYKNSWKKDSEILERVEESLSLHMINTKKITEDGNVWYKSYELTPFAAIIPEVDNGKDVWNVYRLRPVENESEPIILQLPINKESTDIINLTFDISSMCQYPDEQYIQAYDKFRELVGKFLSIAHEDMNSQKTNNE